jgi:hypothetical protein
MISALPTSQSRTGFLGLKQEKPTQAIVSKTVDAFHSMALEDHGCAEKTAETLVISRGKVGAIIHEILDTR